RCNSSRPWSASPGATGDGRSPNPARATPSRVLASGRTQWTTRWRWRDVPAMRAARAAPETAARARAGRAVGRRTLFFDLDARVPDDRAVALLLAAHERAHLFRRAGCGVHAERGEALLQVGRLHRLLDFRGQAQQDLAWRAGGRCIAAPGDAVVTGDVGGFRERRQVRGRSGAARGGHAEGLEAAGLDMADGRGNRLHR